MAAYLDLGSLDQRITIQQRSGDTTNDRGEKVPNWVTHAEVWAKAEPLRGREYFAAAQLQAIAEVRFRIRYRSTVTEKMRVLWRGDPYDIVAPPIDVNGANVATELMCAHGLRDGR